MALDTLSTEAMVTIGTHWLGTKRPLLEALPSAALLLPTLGDVHESLRGAHGEALDVARQRWLRAVHALLAVVALEDPRGDVLEQLQSVIDTVASARS